MLEQYKDMNAMQSSYNAMFGVHRKPCYKGIILQSDYLRNEFDFRKVHGIMNTLGLLQSNSI